MRELALSKMDLDSILNLSKKESVDIFKDALKRLGLPSKKTEHYRYFDVTQLLSKNFPLFLPIVQEEIKESNELIIENGSIVSLPKDFKIDVANETEVDKDHFDQIYYINHLLSQNVIELSFDKDSELKIIHRFTKDGVILPYRLKINALNGAKAKIYEYFEDENIKDSLIFYGYDIEVKDRASFELVRVQDEFEKSYSMVASHSIKVEDNSEFNLKTFDIGEGKISHNTKIDLYKESRCNASHLVYGDKEGVRANNIRINHKDKNAKTTQNARHVLKDRSTAIFDGLIKVENSGAGAITHQNNRSILLNNKAYMVSKPQLEIYIDDLEAEHGSTTGQINPDELFYIRSRGISEQEAKKMIVLGFMKEIIQEVEREDIRDDIMNRFEEIYNRDIKDW